MMDSRLETDGPMGSGSKILTDLQMGPLTVNMTFEVDKFDINRIISFKGKSAKAVGWDAIFSFEPTEGPATEVTTSGELYLNGLWKIFEPLMAGEVKKNEAKELERLKELIES